MSPHQLFPIVNLFAVVGWLLLAVFPRRTWITRTVASTAVPVLLACVYAALVALFWGERTGGFSSLADVALLFSHPWLLLAGWTHYLVFDLLVGHWEVRDARDRGVPHLLVLPCLLLTFFFGPVGWLMYLAVRSAHRMV